jgi:hypothetical protein
MHFCLPVLATASLFTAIVIMDLYQKDYKLIFGHSLLGFVSLLLMFYLCEKTAERIAWGILITPFILIFLGWSIGALRTQSGKQLQQPAASGGLSMQQPAFYGYGNTCGACMQYPCNCREATVQVPQKEKKPAVPKNSTDASGNVILCGANTNKPQCINSNGLPSV